LSLSAELNSSFLFVQTKVFVVILNQQHFNGNTLSVILSIIYDNVKMCCSIAYLRVENKAQTTLRFSLD
jgi:hypothetical protein